MSCRTAFNFLTMRLACVFRLTTNRPLLVLPQSCVKPRKSKVSGRRCPAAARRGGEPPELDQPGLALVERQAELRQPVLERHEKLPRLCLVLAADHQALSRAAKAACGLRSGRKP